MAEAAEVFYMLRCRVCNPEMNTDGYLPFGSAAERGKWAAAHRDALGHDLWHVIDLPQLGRSDA